MRRSGTILPTILLGVKIVISNVILLWSYLRFCNFTHSYGNDDFVKVTSMHIKRTYPVNQLRDYSSLFLRSEISRLLNNDHRSINLKIERYDAYLFEKDITYLQYYQYLYKVLGKHYQNEYYYKNEFLNHWLKSELGKSDSVIFSEFRIGKAIADLAMFNGTSRVFEIKTTLDKVDRLSGQLDAYRRVFNEIYLIVPTECLNNYLDCDYNVGIISFDSQENSFHFIRKAYSLLNIEVSALMEVLYTHEYRKIVFSYFGFLPKMTDFTQFEICSQYIRRIPPEKLNELFVNTIKKRKVHNHFFNKKNSEMNQVCLSLNLNKKNRELLIDNLNRQIIS